MGRYRRGSVMNLARFAPTSSYEMRLHMGEGHPARAPIVTADTQGGTDPRPDELTYPADVTILNACLHTCMADAYNGQGYDREGAHR
jgi:hypothetical protein